MLGAELQTESYGITSVKAIYASLGNTGFLASFFSSGPLSNENDVTI